MDPNETTKESNYIYALPVLFALPGGLYANFLIRKNDPKKARICMIIGMIMTPLWLWMILGHISHPTDDVAIPLTINELVTAQFPDSQVTFNDIKNGQVVEVVVPPPPLQTGKTMIDTDGSNAFALFKKIFSQYNVYKVKVTFMGKFTDQYGGQHTQIMFIYGVTRDTAEKVKNWETYYDLGMKQVSWFQMIINGTNGDEFWMNPSVYNDYFLGQ